MLRHLFGGKHDIEKRWQAMIPKRWNGVNMGEHTCQINYKSNTWMAVWVMNVMNQYRVRYSWATYATLQKKLSDAKLQWKL